MKVDAYIRGNGQRLTLTVLTGKFEGLTVGIPKQDVSVTDGAWLREAIQRAVSAFCVESPVVGYDPWESGQIGKAEMLDQLMPVSPRNASA